MREYAAIGDGRTVALVGSDGAIDWLPVPMVDGSTVFASLLDPERGGSFELSPDVPALVQRRYVPGTGVLETTFRTPGGSVRVTDALTVPAEGLTPSRELVRKVEGLGGEVPMRWRVRPAFGYGDLRTRIGRRGTVPIASSRGAALAVAAFGAGEPRLSSEAIWGDFQIRGGATALLSLSLSDQEPLILPARDEIERRLAHTVRTWRRWSANLRAAGPWRQAVERSAITLKLLVSSASGAIAAAPTTSLPEAIGGARNWDYRYCWIRDSAFTLDALLRVGCRPEATAFFWWLMHASQLSQPRLQVLYRMDGGPGAKERGLRLRGYRGSRPVRVGNGAVSQFQLDIYGDLLETAAIYAQSGSVIDPDIGARLSGMADLVSSIWRVPDAGIWEVRSPPRHFTHSKMMAWIALDRAIGLAERGSIRSRRVERWRTARDQVEDFIWSNCWSEGKDALIRAPGDEDLDAALLLGVRFGFGSGTDRLRRTVDAIDRELRQGPLVRRYSGPDGLQEPEGAFLPCSFWLVEALAGLGRRDEAERLMGDLVRLANDVGLYPEEIDERDGGFLGNFPQALTHLALIEAALALGERR
ncbi:MAG TPA: glycoside hydrolase family 15 protein [Actinomycetota bacterium]|nr:glycoside hydrolase family 15 protein [Actinomycetota bacterium]